ncbi:homoserine kinase [Paenibacillus sp. N1-5-1-14]|uniref:homoserine kinase n=1 Tax=Paenibacillus radicibacter TaxID=2972488 RepID=UPI002158F04C|nr:homoserine kinase [Paenibacillus radicibacter]MCR8644125.1 homoserine kinase [Paenibacillus radicibacter]
MRHERVRVKVPASTANLGPGFDSLGMSLELYAYIEMSFADQTEIELFGDNMEGVPLDKSNLIYEVAQMVFAEAGEHHPELYIGMCSDIPLTRGLGSSASAIVGALVAANALIGGKLSADRLFQLASQLEKHPDNVGASLFGGIVVAFWDGARAEHIRLEPHIDMDVLVAIPSFQLATEKARHVLPQSVALSEAVFNLSHSSLLVAAFATGNLAMIRHAMQDRLHQPHRAALIPGMTEILEHAVQHGALGAALSGAGPTMLALVDARSGRRSELESFLRDTFAKHQIEVDIRLLRPCLTGVQVLSVEQSVCTLLELAKGEYAV